MDKLFLNLPTPALVSNKDGFVIFANRKMETILETEPGKLVGQNIEALLSKSSKVFLQSFILPTLHKEGSIEEVFLKIKSAKSAEVPTLLSVATVEANQLDSFIWVFFIAKERVDFEKRLISMREQLEEVNSALDASNAELKSLNAELEQFAYIASHDLKEPVRSMGAFASFLAEDLTTGEPEKIKESLNYITSSSSKMVGLIDSLLEYSQVGHSSLQFSTISVQALLDEVMERLVAQIQESKLKLTTNIVVPFILTDALTFGLALQNLLQNAMKFRKPGQAAEVCFETAESGESGTLIRISDRGIGIREDAQSKVFEMFKREDRDAKKSGAGIGLAIVEKTVIRHGGKIELLSKFGEGCTFTILLPNRVR